MKIIDGKDAVLGRLASYAAKESLKGEEIIILNSDQVIITGSSKNIEEDFQIKRQRGGSSQKGPKHSQTSEKIVKRTIRNMLPNYRNGRGRDAFKRIRCYTKTPQQFQESEKIILENKRTKYISVKDLSKK